MEEAGGSPVHSQPGLHSKTLSQKKKKKRNKQNLVAVIVKYIIPDISINVMITYLEKK
jgi:hypothetical protein